MNGDKENSDKVQHDWFVASCERDGLISHNALSPYRPNALTPKKVAFTMAEILLSLTIIGVVAAITLPSLTGNINERTWNTQRKALHSRLSQAVALMPQIRGYGNLNVGSGYDDWTSTQVISSDNATDVFLTNGLAKVFKLNNICDASHLSDCGIPTQIIRYGGEKLDISSGALDKLSDLHATFSAAATGHYFTIETKAGAFETANGESVLVHYNPVCKDRLSAKMVIYGGDYFDANLISPKTIMCANFIYDLNGKKGPNTMGKDMGFMTLFYPNDSVLVSADMVNKTVTYNGNFSSALSYCRGLGDDVRLPNFEEIASLGLNLKFLPSSAGDKPVWSATKENSSNIWVGDFRDDQWLDLRKIAPNSSSYALCIKRSN